MLEMLNKEELLELLKVYDEYIQNANDENRYTTEGFYPVCIEEFYQNDFMFWRLDSCENR